ncbi:MAG: hypothetical protein CO102_02395 [Candidatus Brennerbacteria bacterium CG_4_9_14_3_um_filter_43_9]|uniref:PNPLA domain-containing protein n=1 Tax=Candidatus Brennerbacteria bacterium CG_4_9_14_3_um_filter_43_9 TaxID=1974522 RepID=A0A2M8C1N4_9BACT|nr:MAG: hypothetical protein CO102_02395 [Candidatus Brennerbacteria bacterium CG_4_9_14_3_um_filter_43_9]
MDKGLTGKKKIGLALSGGGARGFAHIGVIQEIERLGIPIHCVAGTSMGALVGGWYATGKSVDDIAIILEKHPWKSFFEMKKVPWNVQGKGGLFSMERVERLLREYFGVIRIDDLKTPYTAVAVSLKTGREVDITSGDLVDAIIASGSVPIVFTPRKYGNDFLVDGGLLNNIPCDVCFRMGADIVIGVDVGRPFSDLQLVSDQGQLNFKPWDVYRVINVLLSVVGEAHAQARLANDKVFVIRPYVSHIGSSAFDRVNELVRLGREAARAQEDALRKFMGMESREKTLLEKVADFLSE